ncbi:Rpn family recombination-promoting nuclease/putative transposase [Flavitalea flava]
MEQKNEIVLEQKGELPFKRKNDILWKGLLEVVFEDFLRFVFPNADKLFNMKRGFVFLDKELGELYPEPDKKSDTRHIDKLVKVYMKGGKEGWLFLHVEVQGYNDKLFSERMFKYFYRIYDRLRQPVSAIAIFSGTKNDKMHNGYKYDSYGTHFHYRYNTISVLDYPDELLSASDNPFALAMLVAKKALLKGPEKEIEEKLLEQKLLIARLLYSKGLFDKPKIEAVLIFLNNYLLFKNSEMNVTFRKGIDQITGKKNTMGILEQLAEIKAEEARKEAMKEGEIKTKEAENKKDTLFVGNLLASTDFDDSKIAALANVPLDFVKKARKSLASKKSN